MLFLITWLCEISDHIKIAAGNTVVIEFTCILPTKLTINQTSTFSKKKISQAIITVVTAKKNTVSISALLIQLLTISAAVLDVFLYVHVIVLTQPILRQISHRIPTIITSAVACIYWC